MFGIRSVKLINFQFTAHRESTAPLPTWKLYVYGQFETQAIRQNRKREQWFNLKEKLFLWTLKRNGSLVMRCLVKSRVDIIVLKVSSFFSSWIILSLKRYLKLSIQKKWHVPKKCWNYIMSWDKDMMSTK